VEGKLVTKTLEFMFDFGGPNAYLAHKMLPALCERTGSTVTYTPVLLGGLFKLTNNQPPMMRYAETPAKRDYEMLEFRRFIEANALPFRMNPGFPINSMMLMRGCVAAQRLGCFMPYVDAVMVAMWEEGAALADEAVVRETLDGAGLDADALLTLCNDAEVKAQLSANTEAAAKRGAFGVPTFFVGEDMFWGKERLGQIEAALSR
jgi:2-hydroxychromene-2-carboxylate isomerase